jgi:hypothetical protein
VATKESFGVRTSSRRLESIRRTGPQLALVFLLAAVAAGCTSESGAIGAKSTTDQPKPAFDLASAGPEQVVTPTPLPQEWLAAMGNQPAIGSTVVPGTEFGFTVNGSPLIGFEENTRTLVTPGQPLSSARTQLYAQLNYIGTGGMNGTGFDGGSSLLGSPGSRVSPIQVIPDWPTVGRQVLAWVHLPPTVTHVTYSLRGKDRTWVRPTQGTALLSVPRPAAYDGDYATWHTAPFALMQAFDIRGHLVAQQYAPRIAGDNVPKAP